MAVVAVFTVVVFAVIALKAAASSTGLIVRAAERVVDVAVPVVSVQLKLPAPL